MGYYSYMDALGGHDVDDRGYVVPGTEWSWEGRAEASRLHDAALHCEKCSTARTLCCTCGKWYCRECEEHSHTVTLQAKRTIRLAIERTKKEHAAIIAAIQEINKYVE